jgi:hypothetical protein
MSLRLPHSQSVCARRRPRRCAPSWRAVAPRLQCGACFRLRTNWMLWAHTSAWLRVHWHLAFTRGLCSSSRTTPSWCESFALRGLILWPRTSWSLRATCCRPSSESVAPPRAALQDAINIGMMTTTSFSSRTQAATIRITCGTPTSSPRIAGWCADRTSTCCAE